MKGLRKGVAILTAVLLVSASGFAATYKIDKAHSTVGFSIRHLGLSKVHGQFKDYKAKVVWDESELAQTEILIRVAINSIDTGIKKRDKHLKSGDFFEAKKYPYITFKSTRLRKTDDHEYMLYGDLTIKGITKSIQIPVEVVGRGKGPRGKDRIGLEGHTKINRFDYGLEWKNKLANGKLIVGDKVKIVLDIQLIKK